MYHLNDRVSQVLTSGGLPIPQPFTTSKDIRVLIFHVSVPRVNTGLFRGSRESSK